MPFDGGLAYQCAEFVTRYYREALSHGSLGGGDAKTFLQGPRGGLEVHHFPAPTRPQAGDLVVQEKGTTGHVGIVESVSGGDGEPSTVTVVQQNWSTKTPRRTFTVTPREGNQEVEDKHSEAQRGVVYDAENPWAGFRRKPGTTPVKDRGGASRSLWHPGDSRTGEDNYVVQAKGTVNLSTVASIYGISLADLYELNPCIGDGVTAPADRSIEIRVQGAFPVPEKVIGTATIAQTAKIHSAVGAGSAVAQATHQLTAGRVVKIYEIVDPGDAGKVAGFTTSRWYRVAIYSGEPAFVFEGLCTGFQGSPGPGSHPPAAGGSVVNGDVG